MTIANNDDRRFPLYPRVGVGIVLVNGDKVLLIRRGHEPAKGEWSVPGGLVNLGETIEQAAARELMEECGIKAEFHKQIDIFEYIEQTQDNNIKYHFVVIELLASYIGGHVKASSDAIEARWIGLDELEKLACTEKIKELVQSALER